MEGGENKEVDNSNYFKSVIDDGVVPIQTETILTRHTGCLECKKASGVLCDKHILVRGKEKFYKTIITPHRPYRSECSVLNQAQME